MKNRFKRFLLWTTVLALLLTGMSAALADTQSATFVLQVRPRPTETPAATEAPAVTEAPAATEAPKPTEAPAATEAPKPTEAPKATEAPKPTEAPEAPKATKAPAKVTFERNEDGTLTLDQNGDPIPVVPEGAEVPVAYQRDENGELVLDKNGDPIVTQTLPAGSSVITSIYDKLDPQRRIDIYVYWGEEEPKLGMDATLTAVAKGYEQVVYTFQWQTSKDDVNWTDIPGATDAQYTVTVTEENYMDYWRVLVIIDETQQ